MKISTVLMLSFLGILFSQNSLASSRVSLKFDLYRNCDQICEGTRVMEVDKTYLLCEEVSGGKPVFLKVLVNSTGKTGFLVSATVEEVEASGKISVVSSPILLTADGEPASLSQTTDNGRSMELTVTPSLTW